MAQKKETPVRQGRDISLFTIIWLFRPDELDIFLKHRLLFPELIAILVIYGDRQKHPDIPDFPNIYIVPRFSKKQVLT